MSIPTSGPFADQNLTALFPKLMKFTPQQLSQVQGVPGWFLASVLGAQQAERNNGAQTTPPTQTVVQQVIDQAVGAPPAGQAMPAPQAPTQMASHGGYIHDYGVASLPYEANYGHGGIVSFDSGGSTKEEAARVNSRTLDTGVKSEEDEGNALVNLAKNNPKTATAVAALIGSVGVAAITPLALAGAGVVGTAAIGSIIRAVAQVGARRAIGALVGGTVATGFANSALNTANTPLPTKAPPGDTREAFMDPDALGMANPDPVDFPAEDPAEDLAAADPTLGAQPVYGPPGGIPSLENYPEFTPQELPPEYDLKIEAEKQAKANERFGVDPDYSKNELAKNAAQIQKTKQDAIGVFSGEGLSRLGIALANNNSGKGFLTGLAEAAPEYAAATREGIESARTRTDLLDTRGELLRGQEQERNVGRADAAFAAQKKREDEIRAAESTNRTGENSYNINRFTAMAEQRDRTSALSAQFAQITENARQFGISSLQAAQKIEAESRQAHATLARADATAQTLAAAKDKENRDANATTMIKAFSADYAKLMAGSDFANYPPEGQQAYVDARMADYRQLMNPVSNITTDDDSTSGIGSLRRMPGKFAQGLYTSPYLENP